MHGIRSASCILRLGAYRESIDDYNHTLALKPDLAEAIQHRAEAYMYVDRLEEAKAAYMDLFFHDRSHRRSVDGVDAGVVGGAGAPMPMGCVLRTSINSASGCKSATAWRRRWRRPTP